MTIENLKAVTQGCETFGATEVIIPVAHMLTPGPALVNLQ